MLGLFLSLVVLHCCCVFSFRCVSITGLLVLFVVCGSAETIEKEIMFKPLKTVSGENPAFEKSGINYITQAQLVMMFPPT